MGAGGGGALSSGMDLINTLSIEKKVQLELCSPDDIDEDAFAGMVAVLGSPLKVKEGGIGEEAVHAFEGLRKIKSKDGINIKYVYSGEYGGLNTAVQYTQLLNVDFL